MTLNMASHNLKHYSISTIIIGTFLIFSLIPIRAFAAPSANFTATDEQTYGNGKSWYVTRAGTAFTNISPDTVKMVIYLNGKEVETETSATGFNNYWVDVSSFANGTYHVTATVYDAAGNAGTVMALDGNNNLTFMVDNAPSAIFSVANNGVYGNNHSSYPGTFETQLLNESDGITQIIYYLNGTEAAVNSKVNGVDGYEIDTTTLPNGIYNLTATLKDSQGGTGTVTAQDGTKSITFTVSNNTMAASGQTCTAKQEDLNTITTRIVQRTEAQLQTVDSATKAIEQYYTQQHNQLGNYAQIIAQLTADETAVQTQITSMVNASVMNCSGDLGNQLNTFTSMVSSVQTDMTTYIKDVQSLIGQLESNS